MSAEHQDNLITRANYSFWVEAQLPILEQLPLIPISHLPFYQQSNIDFLLGALLATAISFSHRARMNGTMVAAGGLISLVSRNLFHLDDPAKLVVSGVAFGVGGASIVGLKASAKCLYDSGLTQSLYRVLHIQDRRTI